MASKLSVLPETMVDPGTGAVLRRDIRPMVVTYKGFSETVDVPGYYPDEGSDLDGVMIGKDLDVTDAALRRLKQLADGIPVPEDIKRLRTKLGLSQRDAGAVFRVGENAFDKYERGLVAPSGPTVQLMTLLDRHPELVKELKR